MYRSAVSSILMLLSRGDVPAQTMLLVDATVKTAHAAWHIEGMLESPIRLKTHLVLPDAREVDAFGLHPRRAAVHDRRSQDACENCAGIGATCASMFAV